MKVTLKPGLWLMLGILFLIAIGATTTMWSFLRGQEERRAKSLLASATGSLQDRVQSELDQELSSIQRLAAKWQIRPDLSRGEWEFDVRQILEVHPSLLSVAWIENPYRNQPLRSTNEIVRDWRITWSLPTIYDPAVFKIHTLVQENRADALLSMVEERKAYISDAVLVADRGKAFAVYVPAIVEGQLKGAIVGVFHLQVMMDFVFDRLLATDYSIRLMDGYDAIYSRGEAKGRPEDWEHQGALNVFSSSYKLRLWPSPEVQKANERLADLILVGGYAAAILLTVLFYFVVKRPAPKSAILIPEAAEKRRKSEERLRVWEAAISSVEEPIFVAESEKVIGSGPVVLFVNEALTRLTGFDAADLVGKSPRALFGRDMLSADQPEDSRLSIWNKDSIEIEVEMRARPVRDLQQNISHWIVSFKPIVAAPALNESAPGLQTLLDRLVADTPLGVQVFDLTGEVSHWNALAEQTTGFTAAEMIGKSTPLGVQFPTPGFWTRQDLHFSHKNGRRLDLAVWTAPLRNLDGSRSTRYLSLMADLTSEHVEQEKLSEREASFRALVENATDILAILDLDHTLQYVNPAVCTLLGRDPESLVGLHALDLVEHLPAGAQPVTLQLHHLDGGLRAMEGKLQPIPGTPLMMLNARQKAIPAASNNQLLNAIADAILTYDTEYRVTWMNQAAERLYGFTTQAAQGKTLNEVLPDWLQMPPREQVFAELDRQGYWKGEISNFTPAGRELVQDVSIALTYDEHKNPSGAVAIHRDITEKKSVIDALAVEEKNRTLNALNSTEALWDWNLRTDEVYFSPRWKQMLGYADEEIAGELGEWYMLVHPDDMPTLRNSISTYRKEQAASLEVEYRARTRSGHYRWMMTRAMALRDASGAATRLVGLQTDIEEQKQLDEQLLFEAFHDSLTGLPNRALFLDCLNGELAHPEKEFAVAFFDLKEFAKINEAIGARGGDKALAEAGRRIAECLPPGSVAARHGSDEFAALIHTSDRSTLDELLKLIRSRLALPFEYAGKQVSFEASAGYAVHSDASFASGESMLQAASQAMATRQSFSKTTARPEMDAFHPEQFRVFYHPIVALDSGEIFGMEALIRWQHPARGLLTPADFLPAAEASGLILQMDLWMLREACAKAVELNQRFYRIDPLILTVNLSGRHFADALSSDALEEVIHASGIDPAALRIEINGVPGKVASDFINLNLDLDVATAMEAGAVKLAPSIVRGLGSSPNFEQARQIINEARSQNLKVVAEGVESLEQLAVLRELKCHLAQGFYFSHPASINDTERLLARGARW